MTENNIEYKKVPRKIDEQKRVFFVNFNAIPKYSKQVNLFWYMAVLLLVFNITVTDKRFQDIYVDYIVHGSC